MINNFINDNSNYTINKNLDNTSLEFTDNDKKLIESLIKNNDDNLSFIRNITFSGQNCHVEILDYQMDDDKTQTLSFRKDIINGKVVFSFGNMGKESDIENIQHFLQIKNKSFTSQPLGDKAQIHNFKNEFNKCLYNEIYKVTRDHRGNIIDQELKFAGTFDEDMNIIGSSYDDKGNIKEIGVFDTNSLTINTIDDIKILTTFPHIKYEYKYNNNNNNIKINNYSNSNDNIQMIRKFIETAKDKQFINYYSINNDPSKVLRDIYNNNTETYQKDLVFKDVKNENILNNISKNNYTLVGIYTAPKLNKPKNINEQNNDIITLDNRVNYILKDVDINKLEFQKILVLDNKNNVLKSISEDKQQVIPLTKEDRQLIEYIQENNKRTNKELLIYNLQEKLEKNYTSNNNDENVLLRKHLNEEKIIFKGEIYTGKDIINNNNNSNENNNDYDEQNNQIATGKLVKGLKFYNNNIVEYKINPKTKTIKKNQFNIDNMGNKISFVTKDDKKYTYIQKSSIIGALEELFANYKGGLFADDFLSKYMKKMDDDQYVLISDANTDIGIQMDLKGNITFTNDEQIKISFKLTPIDENQLKNIINLVQYNSFGYRMMAKDVIDDNKTNKLLSKLIEKKFITKDKKYLILEHNAIEEPTNGITIDKNDDVILYENGNKYLCHKLTMEECEPLKQFLLSYKHTIKNKDNNEYEDEDEEDDMFIFAQYIINFGNIDNNNNNYNDGKYLKLQYDLEGQPYNGMCINNGNVELYEDGYRIIKLTEDESKKLKEYVEQLPEFLKKKYNQYIYYNNNECMIKLQCYHLDPNEPDLIEPYEGIIINDNNIELYEDGYIIKYHKLEKEEEKTKLEECIKNTKLNDIYKQFIIKRDGDIYLESQYINSKAKTPYSGIVINDNNIELYKDNYKIYELKKEEKEYLEEFLKNLPPELKEKCKNYYNINNENNYLSLINNENGDPKYGLAIENGNIKLYEDGYELTYCILKKGKEINLKEFIENLPPELKEKCEKEFIINDKYLKLECDPLGKPINGLTINKRGEIEFYNEGDKVKFHKLKEEERKDLEELKNKLPLNSKQQFTKFIINDEYLKLKYDEHNPLGKPIDGLAIDERGKIEFYNEGDKVKFHKLKEKEKKDLEELTNELSSELKEQFTKFIINDEYLKLECDPLGTPIDGLAIDERGEIEFYKLGSKDRFHKLKKEEKKKLKEFLELVKELPYDSRKDLLPYGSYYDNDDNYLKIRYFYKNQGDDAIFNGFIIDGFIVNNNNTRRAKQERVEAVFDGFIVNNNNIECYERGNRIDCYKLKEHEKKKLKEFLKQLPSDLKKKYKEKYIIKDEYLKLDFKRLTKPKDGLTINEQGEIIAYNNGEEIRINNQHSSSEHSSGQYDEIRQVNIKSNKNKNNNNNIISNNINNNIINKESINHSISSSIDNSIILQNHSMIDHITDSIFNYKQYSKEVKSKLTKNDVYNSLSLLVAIMFPNELPNENNFYIAGNNDIYIANDTSEKNIDRKTNKIREKNNHFTGVHIKSNGNVYYFVNGKNNRSWTLGSGIKKFLTLLKGMSKLEYNINNNSTNTILELAKQQMENIQNINNNDSILNNENSIINSNDINIISNRNHVNTIMKNRQKTQNNNKLINAIRSSLIDSNNKTIIKTQNINVGYANNIIKDLSNVKERHNIKKVSIGCFG